MERNHRNAALITLTVCRDERLSVDFFFTSELVVVQYVPQADEVEQQTIIIQVISPQWTHCARACADFILLNLLTIIPSHLQLSARPRAAYRGDQQHPRDGTTHESGYRTCQGVSYMPTRSESHRLHCVCLPYPVICA